MRRIITALLLLFMLHTEALAANTSPVMMEAKELGYDRDSGVIVALGNVEVTQNNRILLADRITYNQNTNIVTAHGNVSVLEPTGNVYFADSVELKDDLKQGVIQNFRARLADNSLFAANEARKIDENTTQLTKAVYSPCKICKQSPTPLWQLKADEITVDEKEQRITYRDAFMELYGIPVLYTPYLSHATPGADNKSGFLLPQYKHSSNLGLVFQVPYYIAISPDKDATLTPMYTSKEGPVMIAEYRQLTDKGEFSFEGSGTYPDRRDALGNQIEGNEFRGHVRSRGQSQINDVFNWGFDINRATDDTYMRKYNFGNEDLLTSKAYVEGMKNRSYGIVQALAFQGLNVNDDPGESPLAIPLAEAKYESDPLTWGSRVRVEGNALVLTREKGSETRRASVTSGMRIPYITDSGHVFEADAQVRADVYDVDNFSNGRPLTKDTTQGRIIPQLSLYWRYPMIKQFKSSSIIVEPIAGVVTSPNGSKNFDIPNEDSQSQEFSDSNLFDRNHFAGYDRVETGTRVNYGLRGQWQTHSGAGVRFVAGQSYYTDSDSPYPYSVHNDGHWSDYVGRIGMNIAPVDIAYRFQIDRDSFEFRRNEVNTNLNMHPVVLNADYIAIDTRQFPEKKEEAVLGGALILNENWTFTANGRRDLSKGGGMVAAGSGLSFHNECVQVDSAVNRTFIRDRDFEPDTSFSVRVFLKNIN